VLIYFGDMDSPEEYTHAPQNLSATIASGRQ
jgi:hypothetical protein